MSQFDLLSQVTIGQYLPGESILHRLDPRCKLVAALVWLGVCVASPSLPGLAWAIGVVLAGLALAQVPLRFAWRGPRAAFPFLALLALLQVFMMPGNRSGGVLWQWRFLVLTASGIEAGALLLARFLALIWLIALVSFTTTTSALVHGVDELLSPLGRLGFPAHELALTMEIALRSVPLLAQEAERLAKAQASRGGDLATGRGGVLRRVRRALPLLVPLFLSALDRAERLALAMEARGYMGGKGRTRLATLRARPADWLALAVMITLALGVILL